MINVLITAMDASNVSPGSRDTCLTLAAAHRVYYTPRCEAMVIVCEGVSFIKRMSSKFYHDSIVRRGGNDGVIDFTGLGMFLAVDSSISVDSFIATNYNLFAKSVANWDSLKPASKSGSSLHGMSLNF